MKKSVCMKGNDPFTHTDYRIEFFPHSCEAQKNLTVLKELLLFRQKYGKRTSFSRNGSNLDITALAGYDLSGKI